MSGRGDMKRKLSNTIEKKPTMLRRGFFNPVPKEPAITWESLREKMNHIWEAGEKGFIDDMPLEVLVRIFARHDNVPGLCLVNKFFLDMTRSGVFRVSFIYLNICPLAHRFKTYLPVVPSVFNNCQLNDVVLDPILWKRLLKSKRNSKSNRNLFGTGTIVYVNDHICSYNDTGIMLYEGNWICDMSEHGFKIPHGLGTCYSDSHFSISGTWDSGSFRTGSIYYDNKMFIDIKKSSVISHRTASLQGLVCHGDIQFDSVTSIKILGSKDDETPIIFRGTWLYPNAFDVEAHFCDYFIKATFVEGALTFEDEVHTGYFIENVLDRGIIKTISTGATKVVESTTKEHSSVASMVYIRRNAYRVRRQRIVRWDAANNFFDFHQNE